MAAKKPTGRPKGKKDSRPRKKKIIKKAAKKKRPVFEKSGVQVTLYPRAGDNPAFENLLDKMQGQLNQPEPKVETIGTSGPEPQILMAPDVAELIKWPFELWANSQQLDALRISDDEARSVAEPLARILERHHVGRFLPPDALDGIQIAARVTPIMMERFRAVKDERKRRGQEGNPGQDMNAGKGFGGPIPAAVAEKQGAAFRKPTEM